MSSIANIKDSSFNIEANDNIKEAYTPKKCRKLYVIIGVVAAAVVITTIVLLCVFLTRNKKPEHIKLPKENIQNSKQGIQFLIQGNGLSQRGRNLQEGEKETIQILGTNFNELNSTNTIILIDNKTVDFDKYISIDPSKTTKVEIKFLKDFKTFKEMFKGCRRLKEVTLKNIDAKTVTETTSMFEGCSSLSEVKFENITTKNIQSTSKMFKDCSSLNKIEIEDFSTENTKDMSEMFEGCSNLSNASFIEGLSTKSSENMAEIFSGCSKIQSLDLSGYDTSKVKDMSGMFKDMMNLKDIQLKSFDTKNVIYMGQMFENCSSITELNLSNFNTEKTISMNRMFYSCVNLLIIDLSSFNLTNRNISDMIGNTKDLLFYSINEKYKNLFNKTVSNQAIELLIVGNTTKDIQAKIFGDSFNELNSSNAIIKINTNKTIIFNKNISVKANETTNATIIFSKNLTSFKEMFKGCNRLKNVTLKNVKNTNLLETTSMFEGCTGLYGVIFEDMNINNINSTSKMFKDCSTLNYIDLDNFSTENTKDMSQMFEGCSSMRNPKFMEGLSTKSSENMTEIFSDCSKIQSLDLSGYDTSNVKDMSGMFKDMTIIETLNLTNFNTEKVVNMKRMFYNCISLKSLDLSSFNMTNCKNTEDMFYNIQSIISSVKNEEIMKLFNVTLPSTDNQYITLLVEENKSSRRRRNLQESEERIQILGANFNELDSSNANIYINDKKVDFNKNILVKLNGTNRIEIKFSKKLNTFKEMFKGCDKISNIILKDVKTENILETSSMFEGCNALTEVKFENINIKDIQSTSKMFKDCSSLNKIEINNFNTENTKDMSQMFEGCSNLDDTTFMEGLSTKNSENMTEMFSGCSKIQSLDLSGYDTSNVKDMSGMFKGMSSLEQIDVSNMDTKNVENMNQMFENCIAINQLNLSSFNTEKVKDMSRMFYSCDNLTILDVSSFNLTNCDNTEDMIHNATDALKLSIENEEIQKLFNISSESQKIEMVIEGSQTSGRRNLEEDEDEVEEKIKVMGETFDELGHNDALIYLDDKKMSFNKYISVKSSKTVKLVIKFTKKIATFREMFSGCQRIKEVSLKDIETELVFETTSMFEGCSSLTGVKFENTGIYNITSTAKMFQKCSSLNMIEIETFSTDKTKDMSKMFDGCSSLDDSTFIEGLSTGSVETMDGMFSGCSELKSLDLSGYDTSNVKDMSGMFKGMTSLEELEISSFHTENVEYMSEMFESCTSILSLDLSSFNTEMVINMDRMFSSCLKLEEVDLTSFKLTNCNSTESMFTNTTRELMLSIEKNEEVMIHAGFSWTEKETETNVTKIPLYLLFLVDATGSMSGAIEDVKTDIVYIAVNLLKKKGMENYDLSLAAIFYRDPIDSNYDIHEIFDFDKNALNFKNFTMNIRADGGEDWPEDWAGAFNLSKYLSWQNDSLKFIVHIADAPAHGLDYVGGYDKYPKEGNKTDEILTYFAQNNFSIAGFETNYESAGPSFKRAQKIFRDNGNLKYLFKYYSTYEPEEDYLLNSVYDSFQYLQNTANLHGIDISE